jgi:TolB-like protein/tetratricopeptide (TPR) repeat protein
MSDVFISYARSTAKQANAAVEALRAEGYSVWLDDAIPAHRAYADVIEERLREAKAVVVIWSAEAAKSQWVQSEADRAREDGKLVQLNLDGARLPMPFDRIQCADMTGWTGDLDAPGWRKVADSVAELVGERNEPRADVAEGSAPAAGAAALQRRLNGWGWWAAAAVIGLALAIGGVWLMAARPWAPLRTMRVAVLPFDAVGPDQGARSFADTLADQIVSVLSANQVETLSRADSSALRGTDTGAQIARLGVGLVLDGIVRSDGKTLAVQAHLDDARAHVTLWSHSFQAPIAATEGLQTQVAGVLTDVTRAAADPTVAGLRGDPDMLAAYLEAGQDVETGDEGRAVVIARNLVVRAPRFSRGHSLLAWAIMNSVSVSQISDPSQVAADTRSQAEEATREARLALALDSANGSAYSALAKLAPISAWAERESLLSKAVTVAPDHDQSQWAYSVFLGQAGRNRDALARARQAIAIDPLFMDAHDELDAALAIAGRPQEANAVAAEEMRLRPGNPFASAPALRAAVWSESYRDGLAILDDPALAAELGDPATRTLRTYLQAMMSRDAARELSAAKGLAAAADRGQLGRVDAVVALALVGDLDDAFAQADRVFSTESLQQPAWLAGANTMALFSPPAAALRRDPRFMALAARIGLVDYWRASDHWPDFCAEPGLRYDCKAEAARLAGARS